MTAPAPSPAVVVGVVQAEPVSASEGDAAMALAWLFMESRRVAAYERDLPEVVAVARAGGATWQDVAGALGVSRQAVAQRFGTPADRRAQAGT